jgi:acetolactate synthase-1/2/3 large subunit
MMKAGRILLEMLKRYEVDTIFGLPGETTLHLYEEWKTFPDIRHVMVRDERSSAFMAHGYAKISGKPGICESPSPGATHLAPGLLEAQKSAIPLLAFTSDIPLHMEKRNMLTGFDQPNLLRSAVKETMDITRPEDIPFFIRRAFRVATTGRPGPVHLRLPMDMLERSADPDDLYAQREFSRCPGLRSCAEAEQIRAAVDLLEKAERGFLVCGQGAVTSGAWEAVTAIAEQFGLAVGTSIGGKGAISELHPLSVGVVGARGGTSFSNGVLADADLVFFVGSSTDSAGTAGWTLPPRKGKAKVIQLDVSEAELGNNYASDVLLLGDAKATLEAMLVEAAHRQLPSRRFRGEELRHQGERYRESCTEGLLCDETPVHPMRFVCALSSFLSDDAPIVVDPGISAIYPATYLRLGHPGRRFVCNFAIGALGFGLSAAIGAAFAAPGSPVTALSGDGSFGFCAAEMETLARTKANVKLFLFDNRGFGWIRATNFFEFGTSEHFSTDFDATDYCRVAEGFGLRTARIAEPQDLEPTLRAVYAEPGPVFVEVKALPEDQCVPPVPGWARRSAEKGIHTFY